MEKANFWIKKLREYDVHWFVPFLLQNTVSSEETADNKQEVRSHLESKVHHVWEGRRKQLLLLVALPGFNSGKIPLKNSPVNALSIHWPEIPGVHNIPYPKPWTFWRPD